MRAAAGGIGYAEIARFQQESAEFARQVEDAGQEIGRSRDLLRHMKAAALAAPRAPAGQFAQLDAIDSQLTQLNRRLYGDAVRSGLDESITPSLASRAFSPVNAWRTTKPATATQRRDLEIAREAFAGFANDLDALDKKLKAYQASYKSQPFLASHPAYNYIARRYNWNIKDLDLDPEEMPSDEALQTVREILEEYPAKYLIWEAFPTKAIADRIEKELGLTSIEFSPCELLSEQDQAAGKDYLSVMRANLQNISMI